MKRNSKAQITGAIFLVLGSFFVFGSLLMMNGLTNSHMKRASKPVVNFQVEKKVTPKRKKPVVRKKKVTKQVRKNPKAPPPKLNTMIGDSSFGLSLFEMDLSDLSGNVLGDMKDVIMTEDSVDTPPRVLQRMALEYPAGARSNGITGFVTVRLLVSPDGTVLRSQIFESEPKGVFDDVTLASVSQWKFEPAKYKGQSVSTWAKQKISFRMN